MEKMTRKLFEAGELFCTVVDAKNDKKHTYRYFQSGRVERYFLGIQTENCTERYAMIEYITDEGFTAWVELFNKYFEREVKFDELELIEYEMNEGRV